ncbi:hypothetical protein GJ496_001434 [Pomphorhynchus laevis]|nr:hypothetical protein GJ496_001434 [Pomphorhynchus laevis]
MHLFNNRTRHTLEIQGIYDRDVEVNLTNDIVPHGNVSGRLADQGDTTLTGMAYGDDNVVWIYKPYALAIINLISQRFGYNELPRISYRYWPRGRATSPVPGAYGNYVFGQTAFVDGLAVMRPGHLPTYNWETDSIIAPFINRDELGDILNLVRGSDYSKSMNVGIGIPRIIPVRVSKRPLSDAYAFYSVTSGVYSSKEEHNSEN